MAICDMRIAIQYLCKEIRKMKRIITLLLALAVLFAFASCTKTGTTGSDTAQNGNTQTAENTKLPEIVTGSIVFRDIGTVTFEIYTNAAPQSALNFIYLAKSGHYNGVIVDRLVKDFVIQLGRYESGFLERATDPDYTIKGEFTENGIENNLALTNGAIAFVTEDGADTAHTEIAIYPDAASSWGLAGKVAVFGYITGEDSFSVLDKINKRKTHNDKPKKEIIIDAVIIDPVVQDGFAADFEFPLPDMIKK